MSPTTNAVPQRTTPYTEAELEQFRADRAREVDGDRGRLLVDQLVGRSAILPAWREALGAVVPVVHGIVSRIHAARHPESPGGSAITADEAKAIVAAAVHDFEAALWKLLGVEVAPAPVVPQSTNPERKRSKKKD